MSGPEFVGKMLLLASVLYLLYEFGGLRPGD